MTAHGIGGERSGPRLRADLAGYVNEGRHIDGFSDDETMAAEHRRQVAEWAREFTPEHLTDPQRSLLSSPKTFDGTNLQILRAAAQNADVDLPRVMEAGLHELLSGEQRLLMREPWRRVRQDGKRREYPLSAGELARLVDVNVRRVRDREKRGLLPGYRINGRIHFFSAAAIEAFVLAHPGETSDGRLRVAESRMTL